MHLYFMGVCGTAMGNAALLFRAMGHTVSGSDTGVYPPMSDMLRDAGITILEGWDPVRLEALKPDLVVVGNVVSRGHPEIEWLMDTGAFPLVSLPELFRTKLLNDRNPIVVAGTHGKTTTTCLAAYLLLNNKKNPGWLVGGVPRDLPSGAHPGDAGSPFAIEGDEYDTAFFDKRSKFIQYLPRTLVINNVEFDHADIFRDLDDVLKTFTHVTRVVPRSGRIVANGDDANVATVVAGVKWCPVIRVGTGETNDCRIVDFVETPEGASFRLLWKGAEWAKVVWSLPGLFNARNAAMAAVASGLAVSPDGDPTRLDLSSLRNFLGVKRRQEVHVDRPDMVVLEDFGHHPTAIALTLESLRRRYPRHRIAAAFEPRSNTAVRKVLQDAFRDALAHADAAFIAPVHRAETYRKDDRLDTVEVADELARKGLYAVAATSNEHLLAALAENVSGKKSPQLVVFFSNGAFGGIIRKFSDANR